MITDAQLGWFAAVIDLKGIPVWKQNKSRATAQLVLVIQSKDMDLVAKMHEMTGTTSQIMRHREAPEWMQRGCSQHCPDAHVHHPGGWKLPDVAQWTATGAAALIILHNCGRYMTTLAKYAEFITETKENLVLAGQGSGMVRSAVRRLAALGWRLPPEITADDEFKALQQAAPPPGSLMRLFT